MTAEQLHLRVLETLAASPWPLKRRTLAQTIHGDDFHGLQTHTAIRWLEAKGYIADAYDPCSASFYRCWRITPKGQLWLEGAHVFSSDRDGAA